MDGHRAYLEPQLGEPDIPSSFPSIQKHASFLAESRPSRNARLCAP